MLALSVAVREFYVLPKGTGKTGRRPVSPPLKKTQYGKALSVAQDRIGQRVRPKDSSSISEAMNCDFEDFSTFPEYHSARMDWSRRVISICDRYLEGAATWIGQMLHKKPHVESELGSVIVQRMQSLIDRINKALAQFNLVVKQLNDEWDPDIGELISAQHHCFSLNFFMHALQRNENAALTLEKLQTMENFFRQCQVASEELLLSNCSLCACMKSTIDKARLYVDQNNSYLGRGCMSEVESGHHLLEGWEKVLSDDFFTIKEDFISSIKIWNFMLASCEKTRLIYDEQKERYVQYYKEKKERIVFAIDGNWRRNERLSVISTNGTLALIDSNKRIEAATAIQTRRRGCVARATVKPELDELRARLQREAIQSNGATRIQTLWRGHAAQKHLLRSVAAATTIQRCWMQKPGTSIRPTLPKPIEPAHAPTTRPKTLSSKRKSKSPPRRPAVLSSASRSSAPLPASAMQYEVRWGDASDRFWKDHVQFHVGRRTKDGMSDLVTRPQQVKYTDRSILPNDVRAEIPVAATVYHRTISGRFTLFFYQTNESREGRPVKKSVVFGLGRHKTGDSATYRVDFWIKCSCKWTRCRVTLN